MKKFFLIMLLFVLPLQLSWAAASAYCMHEEGKAARHLGHHGHQHQAKSDQPAEKKSPGQPHSDCNFCHGIGQASLPAPASLMLQRQGSVAIAASPFFYASHIPDGPKPPDWTPVD
ncbi:hypothetical protein [Janthinobacterium agaricidamnosum]|uniref:Cobalt-zinc-cadmium resistance CzcI n=1 Tax=Janthinobacterium agaricidamnosum NBRC 102515 = DSM 9628 TaxID=1349767 RepID=W0V962_9BURK|nr:hypothetical protein [Janthinobacterium agaricidamnosum]CDG85369.1 cobalt-zinc-cadmium resistance CzcI [Janthinobacterium agaricidamnosum NBRC 102515 = DSM 9628]